MLVITLTKLIVKCDCLNLVSEYSFHYLKGILHDLNCSLDLIFELTFHNISGLICYQVGSVIE